MAFMIYWYAFSIRSTLSILANVFAFVYSIAGIAFRCFWAILIDIALDRLLAAVLVGITHGTLWTLTLERASRIVTESSLGAGFIRTKIYNFTSFVRVAGVSRLAVTHLLVMFGRAKSVFSARIVNQTSNLACKLVA